MAQTTPGKATDAADSSAYRVTERGPHSRVWSRVVWEPGPAGDPVRLVRTYTELQATAHYWADGQWPHHLLDSEEYKGPIDRLDSAFVLGLSKLRQEAKKRAAEMLRTDKGACCCPRLNIVVIDEMNHGNHDTEITTLYPNGTRTVRRFKNRSKL